MYYEKVRQLVDSGRLRILLIIAPPRTSSTLLESSLSLSPSVNSKVNEPFMRPGQDSLESDMGYKSILEGIDTNDPNENKVIVVKEMPYWLNRNEEYERIFSLTSDPVLFLIRNPLLSMESRIKKIIQSIPMKARVSTQKYILDSIVRDIGYEEWKQLGDLTDQEVAQLLKKVEIETEGSVTFDQPDLELQKQLLGYYARSRGFSDWNNFVQGTVGLQDYSNLGEVLSFGRQSFTAEASDWKALHVEANYLESHKLPFSVIDSTELRLCPETVIREICVRSGIEFSLSMVRWKEGGVQLDEDQKKPQNLIWHENLASSQGIKPPFEISPRLKDFPLPARECLRNVDLPVYFSLSNNPNKIRGDNNMFNTQFSLNVLPNLHAKYEVSRTLPKDTLGHTEEIMVRIQDIDPIFSSINNRALLQDVAYLNRMEYYSEELNEVFYATELENQTHSEGDRLGRRK